MVDFGSQFWRPLDLGGSIRSAVLNVFSAATKSIKNERLLTIIPLKSEKPNTCRNAKRIDPLVFVWLHFWRPLDFGGPIRLVFIYGFGANTTKNENHMYFWTDAPRTLKNGKRKRNRTNAGSMHVAFLHVFAFFDAVRKRHIILFFSTSS